MYSFDKKCVFVLGLLAVAGAGKAQIVTGSTVNRGVQISFASGFPTFYASPNANATYFDNGSSIKAGFSDYTEIIGPRSNGTAYFTDAMTMNVQTQNVPVLLNNITFGGNFRLIVGGSSVGSLTNNVTGAANTFAMITEGPTFDPTGLNNVLVSSVGSAYGQTGVGFQDDTVNLGMGNVILDPHTKYCISFGIEGQESLQNYSGILPTPSVTNEFSSTLHDGQGMNLSMNYQALPEPASMTAMAIGALGLIRRKRRQA